MPSLQSYFERYPRTSLRRLAQATNLNYNVMLRKSREPIPNEVYDYNAVNWAALEHYLHKKAIDWNTLNWEIMNAAPKARATKLSKDIGVFKVGDTVYLRREHEVPYKILYMTDTHIVIMREDSYTPWIWSHSTFLGQGPMFSPRNKSR